MSKWSDVKIYDLSIPIGVNCPPWPTYEPVQMKLSLIHISEPTRP